MRPLTSLFVSVMLLFLALPSAAQAPEPDRGSVLISYNLADLEPGATDRLAGFQIEADLKIPGTVLSFVGHISNTDPVGFAGVGPRVTHDLGPLSVFGHYLFGSVSGGTMPTEGLDVKKGGGVEVPLGHRAVIRIGADHDGTTLFSVVGVGVRFLVDSGGLVARTQAPSLHACRFDSCPRWLPFRRISCEETSSPVCRCRARRGGHRLA